MRSIKLFAALAIAFVIMAVSAWAAEAKIKTSAVCGECKDRIENVIGKLDGIEKANLDVDTKILTVKFDDTKISLDKIRKKLAQTGYDADNVVREKRAYNKLPKCCQDGGHDAEKTDEHKEHHD
ncbi:MAG: heavy-metal-associated domain-containing protein [Chloroflexota bacterium]